MADIYFENITKSFDGKTILKNINLHIKDKELFTFLGPSGCGKTTLLRILAGFESLDSGSVKLGERDITKLAPEKREIAMVFQNYALFPHMSVADNVGYGLKARKVDKNIIKDNVDYYLEIVNMADYGKRNINELSGGEQQRVSIARALAIQPEVLLLDEPLSNLDAKLRDKMRNEIRDIQKKFGITTIFVTHDQKEAMAISDTIGVFNEGNLIQTDSPVNLYNSPKTSFVAGFIDESNIIKKEQYSYVDLQNIQSDLVCIRQQDIEISAEGSIRAKVIEIEFNGNNIVYKCKVNDLVLKISKANLYNNQLISVGDNIGLKIPTPAVKKLID